MTWNSTMGRLAAVTTTMLLLGAGLAAQAPEGPQNASPPQATAPGPKPAAPQQKPQEGGVTISLEVPVVTLDVVATTSNGDIITGLKKENFRVLEDGVPQTITNFSPGDAPITMVVLLEWSNVANGWFAYQARYWADALFPNLKQQDWVALVTFDMNHRLEVDFTQNKDEVRAAIYHLMFPGFSESNLFDALLDTVDRLKDVKGKKSVLLLASGIDTFSKHTLEQTLKQLRQTDVTIFAVCVAKTLENRMELHQRLGGAREMTFLQAQNQLKTVAQMTGGMSGSRSSTAKFQLICARWRNSCGTSTASPIRRRTMLPTENIARSRSNWWRRMAARLRSPTKRVRNKRS